MATFNNHQRLLESLDREYFFYSHNLNGEYLYMSPSVENVLGYSVEEASQGLLRHITDSEFNKRTLEILRKSASGEKQKTFELEIRAKDDSIKIIEITESPVWDDNGNIVGVDGVAHDITPRKENEKTIRLQNQELQVQGMQLQKTIDELRDKNQHIENLKHEIEQRSKLLQHIINEIPEKLFVKDAEGKFILVNDLVAANFGQTPEEMIGKSDFDFYPPQKAWERHELETSVIERNEVYSCIEGTLDQEDGMIVQTKLKPFAFCNDRPTGLLGIQIDITELHQKEQKLKKLNQELQASESKLKESLKNLKETQAQLVQSEKMRALGALIAGIAHEINTPLGAINASVGNISTSLDNSLNNLFQLLTKFGKNELRIFIRILQLIERDRPTLSSKEKRQQKKRISEKLEQAGFNDVRPLTDLILYMNLDSEIDTLIPLLQTENPQYILRSVRDIYSVRKNTENIKLAIDKASKIVFALKRFAHQDQEDSLEQTNLIENIDTVLTLQHNQIKQGVEVIRDYEEIPPIYCYPDQLIQVWINFISNAIQAMQNKGQLTIKVKNLESHVMVSISDTGHGIPEEIKQKIFEPFFTTKKAGEGTGIGLDIVKKILDRHQAQIEFESEVGKGTTFTVKLPVNPSAA